MPRRSRGCQACRQRRIGCDGTLPACRQCVITNRSCSGPVQDAIIIDQTQAVASRYKLAAAPARRHSRAIVRQPSSKDASYLAYVAEFMSFLTPTTDGQVGRPWLYGLEKISLDQRGPALDISLEAAATVFCGISAKNHVVVMEACRLYGNGLSRHCTAISKDNGVPTIATIITTIVFSLFETIWSTGTAAYAAHLMAARKMMSLADSELAQNRLLRDLGSYIQCQTLFTMIIAPSAYFVAAHENESSDFMARYQVIGMASTSDRLFAELFRLAEIFVKKDYVPDETAINLDTAEARIDAIWLDYQVELILQGYTIPVGLADETNYPDAFTAITIAYFAAARVLQHLVQPIAVQSQRRAVEENGKIILNCAAYLTTQHVNCASLRMSFPLSLVSMHSTSLKQRAKAHVFLQNWLRVTPFTGICGLVDEEARSAHPFDIPNLMTLGVGPVQA